MTAAQMQNSRMLAAASKALAAFRVNGEMQRRASSTCAVEDVPFHHAQRRVRALHEAPDSRSEENSAEEVVTSGGTSAQPLSGALGPQQQSTMLGPL